MAKIQLTMDLLEEALLGASVLGGGNGAQIDEAMELGELALKVNPPVLLDIEDLPPDGMVVTCASVTCPHRSKAPFVSPRAHVRSLEILLENGLERPAALTPNESGGGGIVNGWLEASVLGLPVVDAPCNGRAHPTPEMGSMGLHLDSDYHGMQAFAGGDPEQGRYVEGILRGGIKMVCTSLRHVACAAGGILAVARNPVKAEYLEKHAAPGAIKLAISLGQAIKESRINGGAAVADAVLSILNGEVLYSGKVDAVDRFTAGGIDSGAASMGDLSLTFWREYMTVERGDEEEEDERERLATFPDLITVFDAATGMTIPGAEIAEDMDVIMIRVPKARLLLGAGMRCPDLFEQAEKVIGKELLQYLEL
ncbi:MAG: DUF917 family protein [Synergistaceae bacterium]|nr:DUF917 family protein [Synergistota bacterium]NLM71801.1 DUF917 family protein [Synergistaceae bacterium]